MWLWLAVGGCRQDVLQVMAALTEIEVSASAAVSNASATEPVDAAAEPTGELERPAGSEPAALAPADALTDGAAATPPPAPAEFNPISVPEGPRESSVKWEGVRRAPSDFDRLKAGSSRERDR